MGVSERGRRGGRRLRGFWVRSFPPLLSSFLHGFLSISHRTKRSPSPEADFLSLLIPTPSSSSFCSRIRLPLPSLHPPSQPPLRHPRPHPPAPLLPPSRLGRIRRRPSSTLPFNPHLRDRHPRRDAPHRAGGGHIGSGGDVGEAVRGL
jgi:hypothetical protein